MTYLFSFLFLKSLSENQCVQWLFYSRLKVYFYIVVVCKENPMGRNVFKSTGIICNWPAKYVFQAKVTSDSNMYWREEAGLCLRANFRKGFFFWLFAMATCQPTLTACTVAYIGWLTHVCIGWDLIYIMLKFGHRTQSMHPDFEESSTWGTVKLQLFHENWLRRCKHRFLYRYI